MPFAGEFREGMRLPNPGAVIGGFTVESLQVEHVGVGAGRYEYPIQLVVRGKGGKAGARKALKPVLDRRTTIFSEFGNPYQCSIGTVQVESLGPELYRLTTRGVGNRVDLRCELARFLDWLAAGGHVPGLTEADAEQHRALVADYLGRYQAETQRRGPRPAPAVSSPP